jgi:hypothetical protein
MIGDQHFIYPHALPHDEVVRRISAVLGRSKNADVLADPRYGWDRLIWRLCLEYGLNPAWVLLSLQRERGLLQRPAAALHDWQYALGYVGQDGPGQANPRWNGLAVQLWLCVHQTAWIAGFGPAEAYGMAANLRPGASRWNPAAPTSIQLYGAPGVPAQPYTPAALHEHVILTYTPHLDELVLAGQLLHDNAPEFE